MNTFYHGDCLFVMTHDIERESVDLIYLDPPFFTGKVQKGTAKWQPGAMECSYEDTRRFWQEKGLASYAPVWLKDIARTRPDFAAYLFYMEERLQACHRVLKPTGSIYLHCDWRASHYLKMIMDGIFTDNRLRNEIVWCYTFGATGQRQFSRKHDSIFWYSKGDVWTFNRNSMLRKATSHWAAGKDITLQDWWEIPSINNPERSGYPTQKPLVLLERIINASSNEGDIVLDPFCGCGTAIIAAQRLKRQWIGIDINSQAYEVSGKRINELPLDFTHFVKVERTLEDVLKIDKPKDFEKWVNEYYKATKPYPDKGIDGVTPDGVPIQVKSFSIGYNVISQFVTDAKYHPSVPQPVKEVIAVSQVGFDDGARKRKFEIEKAEPIKVELVTVADMLKSDTELVYASL